LSVVQVEDATKLCYAVLSSNIDLLKSSGLQLPMLVEISKALFESTFLQLDGGALAGKTLVALFNRYLAIHLFRV
jgi:hypothetical protein